MKRKALICAALAACMVLSGCSDLGKVFQFRTNVVTNNVLNGEITKQYKTAIMNGNIEWIEEIIANNPGLDVNYCEDSTALYCASYKSQITHNNLDYLKPAVIIKLLNAGADPNLGDILQLSAYNKHYYITMALLSSESINTGSTDEFGNTPLSMAMENNTGASSFVGYEQVMLLLEAGAEPYAKLFSDNNAENERGTHFLYTEYSPTATKLLMNILLATGEEINIKKGLLYAFSGDIDKCLDVVRSKTEEYDEHENKILTYYAAYFGTPEQYEEITAYTNINLMPDFIVHIAESGNLEMIKYLTGKLDIKLKGNNVTNSVYEALEFAARWGYSDICLYLCDKDVSIRNYAALKNAILSEDLDTVKIIYNYMKKNYGVSEFDIGRAYWEESEGGYTPRNLGNAKKVIDFFFDEGYNMINVEFEGMGKEIAQYLYKKGRPLTPTDLKHAILSGDPEYVKLVLEKGADPDQKLFSRIIFHPWNLSTAENEIVPFEEYLFDENESRKNDCKVYEVSYADFIKFYAVNHDNERLGISSLGTAIEKSNSTVVQELLNYGAYVNGSDFMKYAVNSSAATLRVLIEAGADTSLDYRTEKDKEFVSLAEFYERNGRSDLAQVVREYNT